MIEHEIPLWTWRRTVIKYLKFNQVLMLAYTHISRYHWEMTGEA